MAKQVTLLAKLMCLVPLLWACSENGGAAESDVQEAQSDDVAEVETEPAPDPGPMSRLFVIQTMGFAREIEKGVAPGFDIDGRVSEEGDEASCGHKDYVSPEGEPGIDNQLAKIVPLFDLVGIGAAESLLQSAIEEGGILLMIQVDGIDDPLNDDSVTLTVKAGKGVPLLGTDGLLLSGQTFTLHPNSPESVAEQASIVEGELHAGPFEAKLPILVFGVEYELTLHNARIFARWTAEGGLADGLLGGGAAIKDLYTIGEKAAADDASVLPAIQTVLNGAGDLAPDDEGACQQISATLAFGAVSAFLFPEDE